MSHWQSLAVFSAVAEEGSFSGAAKKLELTQPTVSFHIDNLEKSFGCPLFQRTARGATLTVYGEVLFHNTCKINVQLAQTHNQIKAMVEGAAGKISFGASTVPAEYIVPRLVAEFLRDQPNLQFSLKTGDSQTILAGFANGDFPIAIVGTHPGDGYDVHPLWQDELILIAHPALRAGLGDSPDFAKLLAYPFVDRGVSSGSARSVYAELEKHGVSPSQLQVVLQVGGNEALKSAVLSQVGLGFISRWAVKEELKSGSLQIVNLPGLKITRQFYAVCRQPLIPTCVQNFWEFLLRDSR